MYLVRIPLLTNYNDRLAKFILDLANYIYENPNLLDLSLQGIWLADRKVVILMAFTYHPQPQSDSRSFKYKSLPSPLCTSISTSSLSRKLFPPSPMLH